MMNKSFEQWKKEKGIKDFIIIYDNEGLGLKLWDGDKARDIYEWKKENDKK